MNMFKPSGDFNMEKIDAYSYRLNFGKSGDALSSIPFLERRFDVKQEGGILSNTYIISEPCKK